MTGPGAYLRVYPDVLRRGAPITRTIHRWRGTDVVVHRIAAPDAAVVAILLHGAGGHGGMLAPYGRLLDGRAEVLAPDLPGYGATPARVPVAHDDWTALVVDLVRAQTRPVVLVGASMGGLLAYDVAATVGGPGAGRVRAVVATCLADPADRRVRRAASRMPRLAGPARRHAHRLAPLDRVRIPIRWIVRMREMTPDPALLAVVLADRRGGGGRVSVRFLRTWLASSPVVPPEAFDVCPVVLAHPGADTWTPTALSARFLRRIAAPTELVDLPGCGHLPVERPGLDRLRAVLLSQVEAAARVGLTRAGELQGP